VSGAPAFRLPQFPPLILLLFLSNLPHLIFCFFSIESEVLRRLASFVPGSHQAYVYVQIYYFCSFQLPAGCIPLCHPQAFDEMRRQVAIEVLS
jgi:uncharacterized membrane-anchored protein YitT (DUF2179 family)